jgi:hypothetical protein
MIIAGTTAIASQITDVAFIEQRLHAYQPSAGKCLS